jgi:hypothetical protein
MTASGETMERLKGTLILGGVSERRWREMRADNLARMIAWHRITRGDYARRIILEDIVPDIGWTRGTWLKPRVRQIETELRRSLRKKREETTP